LLKPFKVHKLNFMLFFVSLWKVHTKLTLWNSAVQPVDFILVRNHFRNIKCFEVVNKRGLFKNESEKYILVELPKNKNYEILKHCEFM
jgi:hypothetical protein